MKVGTLIIELQKCNLDTEVILFDENNVPYKVANVFVATDGNQFFSHINIKEDEQS